MAQHCNDKVAKTQRVTSKPASKYSRMPMARLLLRRDMVGAYMKLQARVGGSAGSQETGPKLTPLRNRLLNRESASTDGFAEVSVGEAIPACAPDCDTREVSQGNMIEKNSIDTESEFQSMAKAFEPMKARQARGVAQQCLVS